MPSLTPASTPDTSASARARACWRTPTAGLADADIPHGQRPDAQLVALMQERNPHAFELVYERHAAAALGLARRMVGERSLAEDVAQEAFVSVWRGCANYRPERGSVRTWVLGITRNRAIDALRRRTSQERVRLTAEAAAGRSTEREPTASEVVRHDEAHAVRAAIGDLPDEQRRTIELAFFTGLTQTEIAGTLELPLGTVKGRMRLGLNKLRRVLGPEAGAA